MTEIDNIKSDPKLKEIVARYFERHQSTPTIDPLLKLQTELDIKRSHYQSLITFDRSRLEGIEIEEYAPLCRRFKNELKALEDQVNSLIIVRNKKQARESIMNKINNL